MKHILLSILLFLPISAQVQAQTVYNGRWGKRIATTENPINGRISATARARITTRHAARFPSTRHPATYFALTYTCHSQLTDAPVHESVMLFLGEPINPLEELSIRWGQSAGTVSLSDLGPMELEIENTLVKEARGVEVSVLKAVTAASQGVLYTQVSEAEIVLAEAKIAYDSSFMFSDVADVKQKLVTETEFLIEAPLRDSPTVYLLIDLANAKTAIQKAQNACGI